MEGRHTVAGPWFTVLEDGADWATLDTILLSDGSRHTQAAVQCPAAQQCQHKQ